jgi:phosphoglycolate phosphatase
LNIDPGFLDGIAAIALDKDGTFVDFERTWAIALNHVIDDFDPGPDASARLAEMLGFDRAALRFDPHSAFVGGSQESYGAIWAGIVGLPHDAAFTERLSGGFERHVFASLTLIDGAAEALAALRATGKPLGVATNDGERPARRQLDHLGLSPLFDFLAGYDSGHGAKPGGGMIEAFARAVGVPATAIAMVGDSINDARAARAAGCRMIGVTTGPEAHPDFAALCDVLVPSIVEVAALFATADA